MERVSWSAAVCWPQLVDCVSHARLIFVSDLDPALPVLSARLFASRRRARRFCLRPSQE